MKNPWSADFWNLTEQMTIYKAQGAEVAAQMAKDAGTRIGGPRPIPKNQPQFIRANWVLRNQRTIQQVAAPPPQLSTVGSVTPALGYDLSFVLTRILMLEASSHALGFNMSAPVTLELDVPATNHGLGITESVILTGSEQDLIASAALGISEAAALSLELDLPATNHGLGISESVILGSATSDVAFVNSNGLALGSRNSPVLCPQAASLVVGRLLIAWFHIVGDKSASLTCTTSGWTNAGNNYNGTQTVGFAYRIVGSTSDPGPTWSWTGGSATTAANVFQLSGTINGTTPIGTINIGGGSGTSITLTGITGTGDNNLVLGYIAAWSNQVIPTPSGWTNYQHFEAVGLSNENPGKAVLNGQASGNATVTVSSTTYNWFTFEVKR